MSNLNHIKKPRVFFVKKVFLNNKEKNQSSIFENNQNIHFFDKFIEKYLDEQNNFINNVSLEKLNTNNIFFEKETDLNNVSCGVAYDNGKLIFKDENISKNENVYNCYYKGSDKIYLNDLVRDLELFSQYNRIPNFGLVYDFKFKNVNYEQFKYYNYFTCLTTDSIVGFYSLDKLINDEYTIKKNKNYLHLLNQGNPQYPPYSGWLDDLEFSGFGWIDLDKIILINDPNNFWSDKNCLSIVTKKFLDRKKALILLLLNYTNGIWELNSSNKIVETQFRIVDKTSQMQLDLTGVKNGLQKILTQSIKMGYLGDLINPITGISVGNTNIEDVCDINCKKIKVDKCEGIIYEKDCSKILTTDGSLEDKIIGNFHLISPQIKIHTRNNLRALLPDILNTIDPIHWTTGNLNKFKSESIKKIMNELKEKFGSDNYECSPLNQNRAFHYADGDFYKGFATGGYYSRSKPNGIGYAWGVDLADEEWNGISWKVLSTSPLLKRGLGIGGGKPNLFITAWGSRPLWLNDNTDRNYSIQSFPQLYDNNSYFTKYDIKEIYDVNNPGKYYATIATWSLVNRLNPVVHKHSVAGTINITKSNTGGKFVESTNKFTEITFQDTNECIEGCTLSLDGLLKFLSKEKIASTFKEVITGMCFNGTQGPPLVLDYRNIICSQTKTITSANIEDYQNISYRDFDNTFIYFNTIYSERTKTEEELEKEKNEIYDDKILCIRRIANSSGIDDEVLNDLNSVPPEFLSSIAAITASVNAILQNCDTYRCETDFTTLLFKTVFGEEPKPEDKSGSGLSLKGQQKLIKKLREKELIPGEIENIAKEITKKLSKCIDPITRFEDVCIFTDNSRAYPVRTIGTLYLGKTTKGIATGGKTPPYYYIQNLINETPKNNIFSKYTKQVYDSYLSPIVNLVFEWNGLTWTRKEDMPEDVAYHCGVGDEKWSIYWGGLHSSIERPDISIKISECDTYKNFVISFNGVYNKFGWKLPLGTNQNYSNIIKYTDFANVIYENNENSIVIQSKTEPYNEQTNEEIKQKCPNSYSDDDVYYVIEIEQMSNAISFEVLNQNMSHYYQFAFPYPYGVYSPTQKYFISNTLHRYISKSSISNLDVTLKSINLSDNNDINSINICNIEKNSSNNFTLPWLKITGTKIDARHGKILNRSYIFGYYYDLKMLLTTSTINFSINYNGNQIAVNSATAPDVQFGNPTTESTNFVCDINSKFTVFNINGNLISGPIHGEHTKFSSIVYNNNLNKNIRFYNIRNFSSKIDTNTSTSNIQNTIYYCVDNTSNCNSSNNKYSFNVIVPTKSNYVTYENISNNKVLSTDLNYFENYIYKHTDLCDMLKNGFSKPDGGNLGEFIIYYSSSNNNNINNIPICPWFYPVSLINFTTDNYFIKRNHPLYGSQTNNIYYEIISKSVSNSIVKVSRAILADKNSSGNVIPNFGISSDVEITAAINDNVYYNISNCFIMNETNNYFFPWNILGDKGSIGPRGIAEAFDVEGNYWLAIGDTNNLTSDEILKNNKPHTNVFTILKINKNNFNALYNFVLQKANIYLAECAKSDFHHWYTMLSDEQKFEYEIEATSKFIKEYPYVFPNESVRNRDGYLELINNLISSSIGIFDFYVRLYDYYEFDQNNIEQPFVSHILAQNITNILSNCPLPNKYVFDYSTTMKYSRIEKFNLVSNPSDVFCLSCDACDIMNDDEYKKLYKNKNWIIHNSDFWVTPIVQSPFSGITNKEGFDILLKLNACNNRWGSAIWSMVDNGILFLNYKKNNIFIDEDNNHIVLSSLQSMLTINNYKDTISLDVPVLNVYNEFIFDLNDYKLPNGDPTPIIHYIKKLEKDKNFCDESYIVYTPQYKVQRLIIEPNTIINKKNINQSNNLINCDCYAKTPNDEFIDGTFNVSNPNNPPQAPLPCFFFNPANKNIVNKYLVQNKFKTTIEDIVKILSIPISGTAEETLKASYTKYAVIYDPNYDADYTEWATNFIQEYKAEKVLESGLSEKYYFKYDINEPGSNCFIGKEEINDQNIVFTSWRRFQDSVGLGGDVPLFSQDIYVNNLCVNPYQYFIGQKAFGNPDKAIICGGFNVMENSILSLTHSLWDYKTNAPTFKWNRFVINPEDSLNKNYTYRSFTIFDHKSQKPIHIDSIMGVSLFDTAGPIVIERTGKVIFDGNSNKVKVNFEPIPYFLNNKTFYSIILTPSDNVRVWWDNKQENSFEIYCEVNKWKGEVDWKLIYIEDVSTQNSIIHSINSGKNTYDIFEEK